MNYDELHNDSEFFLQQKTRGSEESKWEPAKTKFGQITRSKTIAPIIDGILEHDIVIRPEYNYRIVERKTTDVHLFGTN